MLQREQDLAAVKVEQAPAGCALRRSLAAVERLRGCQIHAFAAAPACSNGEIEILEINEEALVEAAERLEQTAADEEECAHHLIDFARFVMGPFGHEQRWENRRYQPIEADRVADHRPGRGGPRGIARHMADLVDELDTHDAGLCVRLRGKILRRQLQAACHQPRVRVEEQQKLRLRTNRTLVAGRGKAAILRIADHNEREGVPQVLCRAVRRGVVDDRYPGKRHVIIGDGRKGLQAFPELRSRIPVHDHDVERRTVHDGSNLPVDAALAQDAARSASRPKARSGFIDRLQVSIRAISKGFWCQTRLISLRLPASSLSPWTHSTKTRPCPCGWCIRIPACGSCWCPTNRCRATGTNSGCGFRPKVWSTSSCSSLSPTSACSGCAFHCSRVIIFSRTSAWKACWIV